MKNRFVKIGMLFLVLTLALAAVGVGYAMWDKTLDITGTVNTGEVDAVWVVVFSNDQPGSLDPGYLKDVAETTVIIDSEDAQIVHVTMSNAYPCYLVHFSFTLENVGTIPFIIEDVIVTGDAAGWLSVVYTDLIGNQIEPWDDPQTEFFFENRGELSLDVHVMQENDAGEILPMDATLNFDIEVVCVQWNEY